LSPPDNAFATHGGTQRPQHKKICTRCGADGHTSPVKCNATPEEVLIFRQSQQSNRSVSQLIHAVTWADIDTPDKATNFDFLVKDSFATNGPTKCTEFCADGTITQVHDTTIF
jgi:hypothetical protein